MSKKKQILMLLAAAAILLGASAVLADESVATRYTGPGHQSDLRSFFVGFRDLVMTRASQPQAVVLEPLDPRGGVLVQALRMRRSRQPQPPISIQLPCNRELEALGQNPGNGPVTFGLATSSCD